MKISLEQAEIIFKRKMRTNQIIFGVAMLMGVGVFAYNSLYNQSLVFLGLSFYFVILGALNLPNINKCKSDLNDFKKDNLDEIVGKILDIFPEKENSMNSQNWYMFLQTGEDGKYIEFTCPSKPDYAVEMKVKVRFTKATQLPVEIAPVDGLQKVIIEVTLNPNEEDKTISKVLEDVVKSEDIVEDVAKLEDVIIVPEEAKIEETK